MVLHRLPVKGVQALCTTRAALLREQLLIYARYKRDRLALRVCEHHLKLRDPPVGKNQDRARHHRHRLWARFEKGGEATCRMSALNVER